MTFAVAGDRLRVQPVHGVPGRNQGTDPRASVGLDADHHLRGRLGRVQVGPLFGRMLGHQCMQLGHSGQALWQASSRQNPALFVDELDVVVVLGPVITYEQHRPTSCASLRSVAAAWRRTPGDLMVKCSPEASGGTSSQQRSRLLTTGGRTVCRKTSTIRFGEC